MTELPDRLLRGALHDTASTAPSPTCVDADTLAAWADDTMTDAERAAVEAHAADCAPCLGLLAAMARTEPTPIETSRWHARLTWLLPLATAAAALVIVSGVAVIERRSSSTAVLPSEPPVNRTPAPTVQAVPRDVSAPQSAAAPARPSAAAAAAPAAPPGRRESSAIGTRPRLAPAAQEKRLPIASASAAPSSAPVEAAAKDTAPPRPPAIAAAAPPPSPASPPLALRDEARADGARGFAVQPAQPMTKAAAPAPVVIASPDRDSQWRIVAGAVEHTTDGGQTWQPQAIGIATPVRAGAAPAGRVCWLAGEGGVVLRTTDGATWVRIAFPEPVDLVAVQAGDASHATVTAATGRRFRTDDGGLSWIRQ